MPDAAVGSVRETLKEQGLPTGGAVSFVQARTAHEIAKAHLARLRLQRLRGELVDRARATALVFRLAREERRLDHLARPRRRAMAAELGCDPHALQMQLENHVRAQLASSPRSGPSSAELLVFDGADELERAWRESLAPDPALVVSEWADRHRFLSPRASAEPGRYRTDRTPYMRAIMDALSPSHPARRVVFMKAAQVARRKPATTGSATSSTMRRVRCWRSSRPWSWRSASRASASSR